MTTLILVPTMRELDSIRAPITAVCGNECSFQLCGFGPIAAAARSGALLSRYRPQRVMLVGIAGSYDVNRSSIGTASRFDRVLCDGVGVGKGPLFRSASELGWHQFDGDGTAPRIGDSITIDSALVGGRLGDGSLVTCTAASANEDEAAARRERFPDAAAEDMEGFAVAAACLLAGVPLQIVRGVSNRVGDRNHQNWQIETALSAAAALACELLPQTWTATAT